MENKLIITEILKTINAFYESYAKNVDKVKAHSFQLKYCANRDTIHSFNKNNCYSCSGYEGYGTPISERNLEDFINMFGKNDFYPKLVELIDDWPKDNYFPFKKNPEINKLSEHKKLEQLFHNWNKLSFDQKLDEIMDMYSLQKKALAQMK